MKIQVKKLHEDAVLPKRANVSDAGYDIVAIDDGTVDEQGFIQYRTGISICPDLGYHVEIFPRSSISKYDLALANSIGLVDNGYRGEILVRFKPTMKIYETTANENVDQKQVFLTHPFYIKKYVKGDKIAQLVIRRTEDAEFALVDVLSDSQRGTGGFGSTGS